MAEYRSSKTEEAAKLNHEAWIFSVKPEYRILTQPPKNWTIYNVSSPEPDLSPKLGQLR